MKILILSFSLLLLNHTCFSQKAAHSLEHEWKLLRQKYAKFSLQLDSLANYTTLAKNYPVESNSLKILNNDFTALISKSEDLNSDLSVKIQSEYDKLEKTLLEFGASINSSSLKNNTSVQLELKKVEARAIDIYNQIHEFNYWINEVGHSEIKFRKDF